MSNLGDPAPEGFVALNIADTLQDCLSNGLVVVNEHECVSALNSDAESILHCSASSLVDKPIASLPLAFRELIAETLKTGKNVASRQIVLGSAGPEERRVEVSSMILKGADEASREIVLNISDLGAARKLESNLRRLDRLASLGTLAASMAHEVKNALVPIKTFLELLTESKEGKQTEMSEVAVKEFKRIQTIISQMLRLAGPARPKLSQVHVHQIIEESLNLIRHQLDGGSIQLETLFEASNDLVPLDAYQVEQALLNIFFNSIDAVGSAGRLKVTTSNVSSRGTESDPDQLCLVIQDDGQGISRENMGHLFDTFFTTKAEGTGLGLPITKRIIEEHHGRLEIESDVNQGTSVSIYLPLA